MIVGIDLGTTNSLAAVWKDGKAQLVPNALREYLTPSVVGVDNNGEILVGSPAVERMLSHPELTTSVFKRYMGTTKTVRLAKQDFRAEDLSAMVLRSLKRDVEEWTRENVTEAVISVPAYFNDTQRKATRIAGELAGLKVERLINEPTAAALAYGLQLAEPESQFLVFDLGGGTFDVTVLELFEGVMEVRASAGDNFLGGEDFVTILIDRFLEQIPAASGLTREVLSQTPKLFQALRREAERAKRSLTESDEACLSFQWEGKVIELQISESQFKTWTEALLTRIRHPVERALRDARIRPSQLKEILLVGGATRMPIIRSLVARMFGRFPSTQINPDEAVALGAAVQAGLKARDAALREVVLTDVCPYTLGVEVAQESTFRRGYQPGFFQPIIERNTVVPASRVEQFVTIEDRQAMIELRIFQGESRLVKDNIFLGRIHLTLPPQPKGEEKVDVRFTYDINGLLEVEATVVSTGLKKSIVIEESPGALLPTEVAERLKALAKLKIHPFEQTANRTVVARAERLYEQYLGETRRLIGSRTKRFTDIMNQQDPGEIDRARGELVSFLDSIEKDEYFS